MTEKTISNRVGYLGKQIFYLSARSVGSLLPKDEFMK